ncbi:hypothetical protein NA57DRAFT_80265 [Rhizodiscina lignyota]|uniref:F-box domain-containing protein n=1 Tax=Rhizodiscina lignyota TaxID=1504668 RepID=A0A9P4I9F9_9PEZI|nr:hypothetical protein NA57DRAFT_80265 [Rhizodiscina lignyota]
MLTSAFRSLSNLKTLIIIAQQKVRPSAPAEYYGPGSISHVVSSYLAAAGMAGIKLKSLLVGTGAITHWNIKPGVAVMDLPMSFLPLYANITSLQIKLSTKNPTYLGSTDWIRHTSLFLSAMPLLEELYLSFDDRIHTEAIFSEIVNKTTCRWPNLKRLQLIGFQLKTADLLSLLGRHQENLERFAVHYCDFTGESWRSILECLREFPSLQDLRIIYIAQDGWRTSFQNSGHVAEIDEQLNTVDIFLGELKFDGCPWALVQDLNKYCVVAEHWENIPARIDQFLTDFTVTGLAAESDVDIELGDLWLD